MTLVLPLLTMATMASSPQPCSQTLSVRFGAPIVWLPLPSAPWQAAQIVNLFLPEKAASELNGLPDRLRTYWATSCTSCAVPTAAASGGIMPMRPRVIDSSILSGVPPYSQSSSVRSGKPLLPRASEPWHAEQLLMNRRCPMAIACASWLKVCAGTFLYAAYTFAISADALV